MTIEQLQKLKAVFDTMVDCLTPDEFNAIRYDILKIDEFFDSKIAELTTTPFEQSCSNCKDRTEYGFPCNRITGLNPAEKEWCPHWTSDARHSTPQDSTVQDAIEIFKSFLKNQYSYDWIGNTVSNEHLVTSARVAIAALRRPMPPTSEAVKKAIEWFSDRSSVAVYMTGEVQPNFRKVHQDVLHTIDAALQQYAPITEAAQKAIEWQQSLKQHHQREWEKTDVEWKMEPGAQEQHDELMASFDMAIQALQQYAPKEPDLWVARRMDELIKAVDSMFVGKQISEDDLYGILQVLTERRDESR